MRKKSKFLAGVVCLSLFAGMALGSGSSDETKDIVTTENGGKETTLPRPAISLAVRGF